MRVFLGGTCNESVWRDKLIPMLTIDFFNPVVKDWTSECQEEEIKQRKKCDIVLYLITPRMTGVYSIAESVDDSNKRPEKTVFAFLEQDPTLIGLFDKHQIKSLTQVGNMVKENGGKWIKEGTLEAVAKYLNSFKG